MSKRVNFRDELPAFITKIIINASLFAKKMDGIRKRRGSMPISFFENIYAVFVSARRQKGRQGQRRLKAGEAPEKEPLKGLSGENEADFKFRGRIKAGGKGRQGPDEALCPQTVTMPDCLDDFNKN
jgi:hypothetical protein